MTAKGLKQSLTDDIYAVRELAHHVPNTPEEFASNLRQIYTWAINADLSHYDQADLKRSAPSLMAGLFDTRAWLRDQIPYWHKRGLMTREVQKAMRDVFRALRYASDMLGEIFNEHHRSTNSAADQRAFTGTSHNTFAAPELHDSGHHPFEAGDVILIRGTRSNSAAIARIGDVDSQFSHVGIVHIDDAGKHWFVESLIEIGATISPLENALTGHTGRAALYRYRDRDIARTAARSIYDRVARALDGSIPHIHYDFSMRLDGDKELFCSKLVRRAFESASNGKIVLPSFPTRFDMQNRDFIQRIGVRTEETFAPGDLELEPDLRLIAEWQDYRVTSSMRLQDLIMVKLFEWMEVYGYKFEETFMVGLISRLGRASSRLSKGVKQMLADVIPIVPPNMPRKTIATIVMLHKTAEPLLETLMQIEDETIRATGRPLHPREVLAWLEEVRLASGGRIGYLTSGSWTKEIIRSTSRTGNALAEI